MAKKLTAKQSMFVLEYLVDLNGTQAAIRAGYSEKTAGVIAQENLKKPYIQAALQVAMQERKDRVIADSDFILQRLLDTAQADIADLYDEDGKLLPVKDWPVIFRKGLVAGMDVVSFAGPSSGEDGKGVGVVNKIKLSDRTKILELMGKHTDVAAFVEKHKHEIGGYDGGPIEVTIVKAKNGTRAT